MPVISVDKISKSYRGQTLFEGASAEFDSGQITAITGPNGSGKSVLFRMICGFTRPDAGSIRIAPEFMSGNNRFPEQFGILIDGPGYLPFVTGYGNLERLARIHGIAGRSEIVAAMEAVGLDPNTKQYVRNYSLGMKQKLGIAQAIMEDQQVLLLDEPFNGLDRDSTTRVRQLILDAKTAGKTVIFSSHIREDVEMLADKVYEVNSQTLQLQVK